MKNTLNPIAYRWKPRDEPTYTSALMHFEYFLFVTGIRPNGIRPSGHASILPLFVSSNLNHYSQEPIEYIHFSIISLDENVLDYPEMYDEHGLKSELIRTSFGR